MHWNSHFINIWMRSLSEESMLWCSCESVSWWKIPAFAPTLCFLYDGEWGYYLEGSIKLLVVLISDVESPRKYTPLGACEGVSREVWLRREDSPWEQHWRKMEEWESVQSPKAVKTWTKWTHPFIRSPVQVFCHCPRKSKYRRHKNILTFHERQCSYYVAVT